MQYKEFWGTMSSNSTRYRRKLFIDSAVQGALLRRLFVHWLYALLMALVCLILTEVFRQGVTVTFAEHIQQIWQRYGLLFLVMAMLFPIFAYDTIKLSHRFAGPVYAVRLALRRLAGGGDIPEVTFRKGDYWTDMAADLNQIAQRLGQQKVGQTVAVTDGSPQIDEETIEGSSAPGANSVPESAAAKSPFPAEALLPDDQDFSSPSMGNASGQTV